MGAMAIGIGVLFILAAVALNLGVLVWIYRDARGGDAAILWMLLTFFTGPIGIILYLLFGRRMTWVCSRCGTLCTEDELCCHRCGWDYQGELMEHGSSAWWLLAIPLGQAFLLFVGILFCIAASATYS